jgi:hypothetical protein
MYRSKVLLALILVLLLFLFNFNYPSEIIFPKIRHYDFNGEDYITNQSGDVFYNPDKFEINDKDWVTFDNTGNPPPDYDSFEKKYNIDNPYTYVGSSQLVVGRFYLDINSNNIPELFICSELDSGKPNVIFFEIDKTYYRYLGEINFHTLKVLPTKFNGMHDLLIYTNTNYLNNVGEIGAVSIIQYNGTEYKPIKSITHEISWVSLIKYLKSGYISQYRYIPDVINYKFNKTVKPLSPADDEKYRKRIK